MLTSWYGQVTVQSTGLVMNCLWRRTDPGAVREQFGKAAL